MSGHQGLFLRSGVVCVTVRVVQRTCVCSSGFGAIVDHCVKSHEGERLYVVDGQVDLSTEFTHTLIRIPCHELELPNQLDAERSS